MSYLTQSYSSLQAALIADLEGEGFDFNELTTSWSQYLATALGEPNAYLVKSPARMLAEINAQYGGTLSHLTSSIAQLLDDVNENITEGGEPSQNRVLFEGNPVVFNGNQVIYTPPA